MITTGETLSVNGTVLNTLAYNISTLAGRLRAPNLRTENIVVPGRHGTLRTPRKMYEEGQIVLPMWVRDTDVDDANPSRGQLFENIDLLSKLFRPGQGLLEVVHTLPDGSARRAMAESTEVIDFVPRGSGMAQFSVSLKVPGVFWEDADPVSVDLAPTHNGPVAVLSGATAPIEDAVFLVTGPITEVRVEALVDGAIMTDPVWFKYLGVVAAGQTLTIDVAEWNLTGGGGHVVNYSSFSHQGSARWLIIEPGSVGSSPGVKVSGFNTSPATKINLTARRKYLVG